MIPSSTTIRTDRLNVISLYRLLTFTTHIEDLFVLRNEPQNERQENEKGVLLFIRSIPDEVVRSRTIFLSTSFRCRLGTTLPFQPTL